VKLHCLVSIFNFLREVHILSVMAVLIFIPTDHVHTSHQHLLFSVFLIIAILIGVTWFSWWAWFAFWWSVILTIFSYTSWLFVCLLRNVY
jgi:hypothetical protein